MIDTPTFDALANNGLRYTNFHTTAICAPTRSALLTGRNSASVHVSGFSHTVMSAGFPGWDGRVPATAGTIAEILRDNGYNSFAVGKYGVTPDEEATDAGPFDHWPTGKGFDHFFGFLGSQTDQYHPDLVEDQAHVKPDGRHLSDQITDKAIFYIDRQEKVAPGKPFFLYYAPGATHAPHQVDKYWSDLYKGKFDEGWDVYREKVFERQKKLGVIPANAVLPDHNSNIKAWESLSPEEKKLYARFMEVYAGYLTYTDFEIGRLVNHLKEIGQLDNTLIFISIGDNGASKEGTLNGMIDQSLLAKPVSEQKNIEYNLNKIGEIGTPSSTNGNYPLGWAQAADTPFKYWKQDANSEGGTHNPLIVYWPKGIKEKGGFGLSTATLSICCRRRSILSASRRPRRFAASSNSQSRASHSPIRSTMPTLHGITMSSTTTSSVRDRSTRTAGRRSWPIQAVSSRAMQPAGRLSMRMRGSFTT